MGKSLSTKSRTILNFIAQGHTYQQILDRHVDLTYLDIFQAAQEALNLLEGKQNEQIVRIRKHYPRAYEKWMREEEQKLEQFFQSGMSMKEIASRLQRQVGAIRTRLIKLGLVEDED